MVTVGTARSVSQRMCEARAGKGVQGWAATASATVVEVGEVALMAMLKVVVEVGETVVALDPVQGLAAALWEAVVKTMTFAWPVVPLLLLPEPLGRLLDTARPTQVAVLTVVEAREAVQS